MTFAGYYAPHRRLHNRSSPQQTFHCQIACQPGPVPHQAAVISHPGQHGHRSLRLDVDLQCCGPCALLLPGATYFEEFASRPSVSKSSCDGYALSHRHAPHMQPLQLLPHMMQLQSIPAKNMRCAKRKKKQFELPLGKGFLQNVSLRHHLRIDAR